MALLPQIIVHGVTAALSVVATLGILTTSGLGTSPRAVTFDEAAAILAFVEALPEDLDEDGFRARVALCEAALPGLLAEVSASERVLILRTDAVAGPLPDISGQIAKLGQDR